VPPGDQMGSPGHGWQSGRSRTRSTITVTGPRRPCEMSNGIRRRAWLTSFLCALFPCASPHYLTGVYGRPLSNSSFVQTPLLDFATAPHGCTSHDTDRLRLERQEHVVVAQPISTG
jgi:hypothetical protein